jgi:hypothetical protein
MHLIVNVHQVVGSKYVQIDPVRFVFLSKKGIMQRRNRLRTNSIKVGAIHSIGQGGQSSGTAFGL